ncbi:LPS export ABC transporter periplasmic protein LptC [Treponema sp.]|uniref:LPS export ABC transporter periplasmic protein LptC n=1 Tax=Treponema sp. TaxID=166 RepID=UPI00388F6B6C
MLKFFDLLPTVLLSAFLMLSCSLKYDEPVNTEDISPELQFTKVDYKRYKEKKLDTQIKADILERYRSDGSAYAKNAEFYSWNKDSELTTEGSCALLGIDSSNDIYSLFNSIFLHNIEQNFQLKATNLKWNGKTEQLVSGKDDTVYLIRDDIEIEGTGFSASGISRSFTFENSVSGIIITEEEKDEEIQ